MRIFAGAIEYILKWITVLRRFIYMLSWILVLVLSVYQTAHARNAATAAVGEIGRPGLCLYDYNANNTCTGAVDIVATIPLGVDNAILSWVYQTPATEVGPSPANWTTAQVYRSHFAGVGDPPTDELHQIIFSADFNQPLAFGINFTGEAQCEPSVLWCAESIWQLLLPYGAVGVRENPDRRFATILQHPVGFGWSLGEGLSVFLLTAWVFLVLWYICEHARRCGATRRGFRSDEERELVEIEYHNAELADDSHDSHSP